MTAMDSSAYVRLNIGCGSSPTEGWFNYDNSVTVRIARYPRVVRFLSRLGALSEEQRLFAQLAADRGIVWANAAARIPHSDRSVDVIYTSHMLEHLERVTAESFLKESLRVLRPGGVLRVAVPDLEIQARAYLADGDADTFVRGTHLVRTRRGSPVDRLKALLLGDRHHAWMYDGRSLIALLTSVGYEKPCVVDPGRTTIPHPGALDLRERESESVYVEARRPKE